MKLDLNSPMPLHAQLKEILKNNIFKGEYTEKIPSERELMAQFQISRTTVREAVEALVREGILEKRHGKGTYISVHPVQDWLGSLKSYTETVESLGMKPGAKLLFFGKMTEPASIAEKLGVEEFYALKRLRYANDKPMAIERKYFPLELGLKLTNYDLDEANIYKILESSMGVLLWESDMVITSARPDKEDAKLLEISRNTSVLVAERLTADRDGNIVELNKTIYRADMYAFHIVLSRKPGRIG